MPGAVQAAIAGKFSIEVDIQLSADGGAGVAALVTEGGNHQVGGTVEHLRPVQEVGCRVDEAAEAHHAHDLVEVAERRLDLGQQVDGTAARRRGTVLDRNAGTELALGDQLAGGVETDLAGDEQQVTGAHERHVIGDRGRGLVQLDALFRQLLLDRARHV